VPRYYFNVYDDVIANDIEGVELPNEAAARLQALLGARDLIAEQVRHGYFIRSHWIDVVDDQGAVLFAITFGDAVDVK
jgi:hypothetical protein